MTSDHRCKHHVRSHALGLIAGILMALAASLAWADEPLDEVSTFDIPPQPLASALLEFSQQANMQIIMASTTVEDMTATGISGEQINRTALDTLLDDQGLQYTQHNDRTVAIQASALEADDSNAGKPRPASSLVLMAQNQTSAQQTQTGNLNSATNEEGQSTIALEEIIVIGSHIRGAKSASPVLTFDREQINRAGFATTRDFIRALPQNFNGGVTEVGIGTTTANDASQNIAGGTGVNLRGLGSDSTLVLLDGHRLSPAAAGTFVDISMIPLTAIENIDVLTDGASAIYGSDAVAGVVNFTLRDDYEGAETRLRYGTVTDGDSDEVQFGQIFGSNWRSGNALISYEYYKRERLDTADRSFTSSVPVRQDLLPEQERHSFLVNARQDITDKVNLSGNVFYSQRDSDKFLSRGSFPQRQSGETKQYGLVLGSTIEMGSTWLADIFGSFNRNETSRDALNLTTMQLEGTGSDNESTVGTLDAKFDGPIFRLPGGEAKLAVGLHYRNENFKDATAFENFGGVVDESRDVTAVFGEVFLPIVGEANSKPGIERLELTFAGRYEDYSDFGSSSDPKVGLLWSPISGLSFRGTYGTSFRAPLFDELIPTIGNAFLLDFIVNPDTPNDPPPLLMIAFGNSPTLQAETATTWTGGIDFNPAFAPNLSLQLTYFNIEYEDRIDSIFPGLDVFNPLYASILIANPDPAIAVDLMSRPLSVDLTAGRDPATTEFLFDSRLRNIAGTETAGLDLGVTYAADTTQGLWGLSLNGTYYFDNNEKLLVTSPSVEKLNTVSNPVDLKVRGGVYWSGDRFGANFFINHTDGYKDDRFDPVVGVDSWTTADLNLNYRIGGGDDGGQGGTVFALNFQNLFDEDPPLVESFFADFGLNFDSDNASPVGRFVSFQVTHQW